MLNKYETDISINKEVLNNLPKNNIKNQQINYYFSNLF